MGSRDDYPLKTNTWPQKKVNNLTLILKMTRTRFQKQVEKKNNILSIIKKERVSLLHYSQRNKNATDILESSLYLSNFVRNRFVHVFKLIL